MQVVTITNQKGGVGKTTTTLNLAVALRERGRRVLVVDFDPQGSLTTCCGLDEPDRLGPGHTVADAVLTTVRGPASRRASLREIIVRTRADLDLVPSSQQLATAEAALYTVYGREFALRDTLVEVRDEYDLVIVDSVPTLGLLAVNGLAAADGLIIPVQADYLAVHGLAQLLSNVALVRERLNPRLEIWGVLLTMVDGRTRHSRDVVSAVRETLPGQVPVFRTQIPEDVRLKDSVRVGASVLEYSPGSRAAVAYRELAAEVESWLEGALAPSSVGAVSVQAQITTEAPRSQGELIGSPATVSSSEPICLATRLGPATSLTAEPARSGLLLSENGSDSAGDLVASASLDRRADQSMVATTTPALVSVGQRSTASDTGGQPALASTPGAASEPPGQTVPPRPPASDADQQSSWRPLRRIRVLEWPT